MGDGIALRPVTPEDREFLYSVYASTRQEELSVVDWDEDQKEAFLRMQFEAQDKHYREYLRAVQFDVIERDGKAIGRLYVERRADEIGVVDIALLPDHRNGGIGGELMRQIMDEAAAAGKPVRIHVEQFNPAMRFYERLGFTALDEEVGVYRRMEWRPA